MRVVVTGATGNVGSAVVRALVAREEVTSVLGLARRTPDLALPKASWAAVDVGQDALDRHIAGADAVIHLAWLIQPSRDRQTTRHVNVHGSRRVFEAAARAGAGALVHASSVGAYSAGPRRQPVDELWPTDGIRTSFYSADKADAERALDDVETAARDLRVVRLRPGLIFQQEAASEIRRYFLGPFVPGALLRPGLLPVLPNVRDVRFQAVHTHDVADAFVRAALDPSARGAYNVAADDVLGLADIARELRARTVPVPTTVARVAAGLTWRARLQPTPPGWLDLAVGAPIMQTSRIREELGWSPALRGHQALAELLRGLRAGSGYATPPLHPHAGGPLRVKELLSGLGGRSDV